MNLDQEIDFCLYYVWGKQGGGDGHLGGGPIVISDFETGSVHGVGRYLCVRLGHHGGAFNIATMIL